MISFIVWTMFIVIALIISVIIFTSVCFWKEDKVVSTVILLGSLATIYLYI